MKHRINLPVKQYTSAEKYFYSILCRTSGITTAPELPNEILYYDPDMKDVNFKHNTKTGEFWVRYDGIWSVIETKHGGNWIWTVDLIKNMTETHYNIENISPRYVPNIMTLAKWHSYVFDRARILIEHEA